MIPLGDDNSMRRTVPVVTYALLALNVFVFIFFQGLGQNEAFTMSFSTVPEEIATGNDIVTPSREVVHPATGEPIILPGLGETPIPVYWTILTSMFMHGGLMHLLGNMLYLWIFGDNVEDRLGHLRFLIFYLICGVVASLTHVLVNLSGENALVPSLGASGAISGVLGAYWVLFPRSRVRVAMGYFISDVPALIVIGLWFVFQILGGLGSATGGGAGVAFGAHIGGFIAGLILVKPFLWSRPISV